MVATRFSRNMHLTSLRPKQLLNRTFCSVSCYRLIRKLYLTVQTGRYKHRANGLLEQHSKVNEL